jgi:signal transduction histidine kinase
LQLAAAKEMLSSPGGDPLCNIEQAIESANLGLAEARRCAHDFRCSVVDESGFRVALQRLAERWNVAGRLRRSFRSNDIPDDRLSARAKHQLLRIAQEAIHNAVRHANPSLIVLTLRWDIPNLVLEVKDDGLGISAGRLKKCEGFGLGNMRKRAPTMKFIIDLNSSSVPMMVPATVICSKKILRRFADGSFPVVMPTVSRVPPRRTDSSE